MKKEIQSCGLLIVSMWGAFILDQFLPLEYLGIQPRSTHGLIGIVASPFLHANLNHIISNTTVLISFLALLLFMGKTSIIKQVAVLIILSGSLTWLIAFSGNHIGASGLIFALFGHTLSLAFFQRKIKYLLISAFVFFSYGYLLFGILPSSSRVSWEGHLAGLIAGVFYSYLQKKKQVG